MAILGDIIDLHHRRRHPRFGGLDDNQEVTVMFGMLTNCGMSLVHLARRNGLKPSSTLDAYYISTEESTSPDSLLQDALPDHPESFPRTHLVLAYTTHILHVLYVLHGKWDVISMLDCEDDWITSPGFVECASHAITASHALSTILKIDPDLTFMPYLLEYTYCMGVLFFSCLRTICPNWGPTNPLRRHARRSSEHVKFVW